LAAGMVPVVRSVVRSGAGCIQAESGPVAPHVEAVVRFPLAAALLQEPEVELTGTNSSEMVRVLEEAMPAMRSIRVGDETRRPLYLLRPMP
jgi:hypothetical protein